MPGAATWLGLLGQVNGHPGLLPPDCWRLGRLRRSVESIPGILATKGNAVTVSVSRATAIKEYFMLRDLCDGYRHSKDVAYRVESWNRGDFQPLYIKRSHTAQYRRGITEPWQLPHKILSARTTYACGYCGICPPQPTLHLPIV
jgi:hypothetical protein